MKNNYDPALEQYFYSIDTDRSGTIDGSELQRALAACGERSDPEFVGMLLRMFGKSRGGTLSFQDFNNVVGFMRQNNEAYNRNGGRPMDLATVEREVAETNRDFPGVGAMMPMVSTLFSSMGGGSAGGVTADKFMLIQTFMSVIRGFMSSGGGGGGAGGAAGLLGGLGGLGGLGALLGGGALGGAALGGLGGGSSAPAAGGYNSSSTASGGYGSAPPQQSYGSSAPSGYGGASQSQGYGGQQGGYGAPPQGGHTTSAPTSSGASASAGSMNSILDQIMGANLGSGPAASGSSSSSTQSYSSQPPAYGGGAQQSYGGGAQQSYGGGAQQSYGGAQQSYGGGQQSSQQGAQALSGFQAPSGYGAPAANNNAGPAFQGVD